jgi:hypothetical protein
VKIALLLPSYRRFGELFRTLRRTPLTQDTKFVVVANYPDWQLALLQRLFRNRAVIVDERPFGKLGGAKAYNAAYNVAREHDAEYVAHWADDIMPFRSDWLVELNDSFIRPGYEFGIFSTDEGGHKHRYGWNIFGGYPCAHFFVARTSTLGNNYFDARFNQFVADNEICIRLIRKGIPITYLPIMIVHDPCMKHRQAFAPNYAKDVAIFNNLYPDLAGLLDAVVLKGDHSNTQCLEHSDQVRFSNDPDLPYVTHRQMMAAKPVTKSLVYRLRWKLLV